MTKIPLRDRLEQTLDFIASHIPRPPALGILTGTGLSDSLEGMEICQSWTYDQLPHFPRSTVESHAGELVYGRLAGTYLLVFRGRFHLYEGYSPEEVTYPVRLLQALGVKHLILNNAAGGIHPDFEAGDIMVIQDHINLTGVNPLTGPNDHALGLRFPDMTAVYSREMIQRIQAAGKTEGIKLQYGVYAGLGGPSLETPAETRYLQIIGAHAVGFSTVMEAIAAVHADMEILGLSLITNINDPEAPEPATLESVLATAAKAAPAMTRLLETLVAQWKTPPT